jgi:ABC-2 type transport system ATP-binding protein
VSNEVSVEHLTKTFGSKTVVNDVGFELKPGSVTAFLGPNGAGKTTTARMMLGLVRPTTGRVLIDGRDYARLAKPKGTVGAVLESTGFHPGRTARTHLLIAATAVGLALRRVAEVLTIVRLEEPADQRVGGFSLGMRQRLGLATALLGDPGVLILDEPANGLDPAGMSWLRELLRRLADEGRTVLISSHILAEVVQIADRVLIIADGSIRYDGALGPLADRDSLEASFLRLTGASAGGDR